MSARAGEGGDRIERLRAFLRSYGTAILPLYVLVVVRSMVQVSITLFVPSLLVARGHSETLSAFATTCYIGGGAVGMLVGGFLTARYNRRWIQAISLSVGIPLTMVFLLADLPLSLGLPLLFTSGAFTLATNTMHILMGQEIAPRHASTVSSLMMGVGWGMGALGPAIVGALSPSLGLAQALAVVGGLPLATFPLIVCLRGRPAPEEDDVSGELARA